VEEDDERAEVVAGLHRSGEGGEGRKKGQYIYTPTLRYRVIRPPGT
jgi:hypothetical protein